MYPMSNCSSCDIDKGNQGFLWGTAVTAKTPGRVKRQRRKGQGNPARSRQSTCLCYTPGGSQKWCHSPGNWLHGWMEEERGEDEAKRDGPLGGADVLIHQLLGLGIVSPWHGSTADFKEGHDSEDWGSQNHSPQAVSESYKIHQVHP